MKELEKDKEKIKTSIQTASKEQDTIGICPQCGKNMIVRFSKKRKRFVGCTGFPDCKNTYPIPQKGYINPTQKTCSKCNSPIVRIKAKEKRAWELCINPECTSKKPKKK
jgi:DNA topoisomerase-1